MSKIIISRDTLWKGAIENFFPAFLLFFYPNEYKKFDLSKGFEFLDKELAELFPESENNQRYVDKLVKVYTYDGDERWILIHIEVQGYYDKFFAERMFIYYYRILDKYGKRVAAIALLTDNNSWFHPTQYQTEYLGTELTYKFRTYKLLEKTPTDFANTDNPFAVIMEVAWCGLEKNKPDDEVLYSFKIRLVRRLKELEYTSEEIRDLLGFINYYVNFDNSEIKLKFEEQTSIILQNEQFMGIHEGILHSARMQGRQEVEVEFVQKLEVKDKEIETKDKEIETKDKEIEVKEQEIEQAKKESEQIKKLAIRLFKDRGISSEEIAELMNLNIEEVKRLAAE